jgi:hypothetical protein
MKTTHIKAIGWLLILLGALVVIFSGKSFVAPNTGVVVRWITLVAAVGVLICLSGIWVLFRTVFRTVKTFRWIARILSVLIILFWGVFITAGLVGIVRGEQTWPLSMHDRMGLTLMFAWLLGLALAWRWELAVATLTLAAFLIEAFFINWRVVAGLGILPPITALLFLLCWWVGRQSRQDKHDA